MVRIVLFKAFSGFRSSTNSFHGSCRSGGSVKAALSAERPHGALPSWPGTPAFATSVYRIAMKTALARRLQDRRTPPCSLESFLPRFDRDGRLVPGRWLDLGTSTLEKIDVG